MDPGCYTEYAYIVRTPIHRIEGPHSTVPVQCTTSSHRPAELSFHPPSDHLRLTSLRSSLTGSFCCPQTLNAAGLPTETVRMSVVPANTPVSVPAASVPTNPGSAPAPSGSPSQFVPSDGAAVSKGRNSTPDIAGGVIGGILLLIREPFLYIAQYQTLLKTASCLAAMTRATYPSRHLNTLLSLMSHIFWHCLPHVFTC